MAKHEVIICCWHKGHNNIVSCTKKQEEKLAKQIPLLKAVCPTCRDNNEGNQSIFIKEGTTIFSAGKLYTCRHGHITTVSAFNNGMLHVRFGNGPEDFVNIEGHIEEIAELLDKKDISCHYVKKNNRVCDCKLKPVDDFVLSYPGGSNIKTKQRLGDLWDKAGVEPVRGGVYDKTGEYKETRSERANRERLNRMRKRNISEDRHPGKRINKATKKDYGRRSKNEIKPEKLKGPQ
jgi:hypothetical protein